MPPDDESTLEPMMNVARAGRQRLTLRGELTLAFFPTVMMLLVLWTVEAFADERVLFAALASSAFLIYLDPMHATNSLPVLMSSHLFGALTGFGIGSIMGNTYKAAAVAVIMTILIMVIGNIMHPPAIGTSLGFAFHAGLDANVTLFFLALGMIGVLAIIQRVVQYVLVRLTPD